MSRALHSDFLTQLTKKFREPVVRVLVIRKSDSVVLHRYATRYVVGNPPTSYPHGNDILWPSFSWAVDIDGGVTQLPQVTLPIAKGAYDTLVALYRNEVVFRMYIGDHTLGYDEAALNKWPSSMIGCGCRTSTPRSWTGLLRPWKRATR